MGRPSARIDGRVYSAVSNGVVDARRGGKGRGGGGGESCTSSFSLNLHVFVKRI